MKYILSLILFLITIAPTTCASEGATIELNFESATLKNVADFLAQTYGLTFITDDTVMQEKPDKQEQSPRGLMGHKVSFRTNSPLTKDEAWGIFTTFLDMAGLAIYPMAQEKTYRIIPAKESKTAPLPTFIGVDVDTLPNSDERVRYVYFLKNIQATELKKYLDTWVSASGATVSFGDMQALMIVDQAYHIKSIIAVVKELDKSHLPEVLSIIPLKNSNAKDLAELYKELTKSDSNPNPYMPGARKPESQHYFSQDARLFADERTNSLIIIGPRDSVEKIENFIKKYNLDDAIAAEQTHLEYYSLQYTGAKAIAEILNKVVKFGEGTPAAEYGSIRGGDKYFQSKKITVVPEERGNRVLIKAPKDDIPYIREVIKTLDVAQPQVAIEVLIIDLVTQDDQILGAQLRNETPTSIAKGVNAQTSGLPKSIGTSTSPITDPATGLLANLITAATGNGVGSTLVTLGTSTNIWAVFKALQSRTQTNILSNPFLITSNKFTAGIAIGETRRIQTAQILTASTTTGESKGDLDAFLSVEVTPQINEDEVIRLEINININTFTSQTNQNDGSRDMKRISTTINAANHEVLVLGGLSRNRKSDVVSQVPVLGSIPVIGWLFKNKQKVHQRTNLLVFISPHIIPVNSNMGYIYTQNKATEAKNTIIAMRSNPSMARDPINRWFFNADTLVYSTAEIDNIAHKQPFKESPAEPTEKTEAPEEQLIPAGNSRGMLTGATS